MAVRKAVIDIGTNSIKFCLAEGRENGYEILKEATEIVRLGEGLNDGGCIGDEALERNARAVAEFAREAVENCADEIAVVGTMALRVARNAADFVARVRELCGLKVQILIGEEEAQLTFDAAVSGLDFPVADLMTMDIGGGSTEFVFCEGGKIVKKFSLDVGAVRFTEKYLSDMPVVPENLDRARVAIRNELGAGGVIGTSALFVGMGGTVTTMAAVKYKMPRYDVRTIRNAVLTRSDVMAQISEYARKTLSQRREIVGLHPKRADVILAGALIVEAVLSLTGAPRLLVSDRSLRHGLLDRMFKV